MCIKWRLYQLQLVIGFFIAFFCHWIVSFSIYLFCYIQLQVTKDI
ncbi:hypothetical protein JOC85_004386 [Bacillus mesophilus]|nr:hypothetical protein [Bacillus mesophilus]